MKNIILTALCLLIGVISAQSQIGVGQWREHLPYSQTIDVSAGSTKAYCATPFAVFSYDQQDGSVERISKVNKLSDSGISAIKFEESRNLLLVGYENGNIDMIINDISLNLSDIKRSSIIGDKQIYNIHIRGNSAFLACGFGMVQLDLDNLEIKDTFFLGPNGDQIQVLDIETDEEYIFAATESGIYFADVNDPFLANFQAWEKRQDLIEPDARYSDIELNDNYLILAKDDGITDVLYYLPSGEVNWLILEDFENEWIRDVFLNQDELIVFGYDRLARYDMNMDLIIQRFSLAGQSLRPNAGVIDPNGTLWVSDDEKSLLVDPIEISEFQVKPDGPAYFNARRIDAYNKNLWIASGGVDPAWTNNYDKKGFYGMVNDSWQHISPNEGLNEIGSINDIMDVTIDPLNNQHLFFSSWEEGLVEIQNGQIVNIYNEDNSPISPSSIHDDNRYMVAGVDFDDDGNLWFTNSYNSNHLHVLKRNGQFESFSFSSEIADNDIVSDVMTTREGQVWLLLPSGEGIIAFDYNGTLDDDNDDFFKLLTTEEGEGGLPSGDIYSFEEDLEGEIWLGTLEGVAVFYTPSSIFNEDNFDASQILIEQDGNIQILLETETVTALEIDGANRKWIGTSNSGVFLMSQDGTDQISHFTKENSPLLSNTISDIAINHGSGEIFFSTDNGIISYIGSATNFDQEISDIKVYPNPVRPEYSGSITIDGLAFNSDVKITDVSGNLVYETRSNGGRAIWNGINNNGNRASTGIYLVFATTLDGEASNVTKLAFIR